VITLDDPVRLFIGFILVVVVWKALRVAPVVVRRVAPAGVDARRIASVGAVVVAFVIGFGLAAWLLPPLSIPSSRSVGWVLGDGFGGPGFEPASAQTTTVIAMIVDTPSCTQDRDWLATPAVTYTPWAVTITMHTSASFGDVTKCGGWMLSGTYVQVQLSEPLGGRALFDGSRFPPHARTPGIRRRRFRADPLGARLSPGRWAMNGRAPGGDRILTSGGR
jgi:hypothetical protein